MIETVENRVVYENDFITIFDDLVRFPDGHTGTYLRSRWKAPHGVAIVPIIGDKVLLLNNFRYTEQANSIEIPQGFGLFGATPEDDARRELFEETGLTAYKLEPLTVFGQDYKTHVFIARFPASVVPTAVSQEATESIASYEWMPIHSISLSAIQEAGIYEAGTVAALFAARDVIQQ